MVSLVVLGLSGGIDSALTWRLPLTPWVRTMSRWYRCRRVTPPISATPMRPPGRDNGVAHQVIPIEPRSVPFSTCCRYLRRHGAGCHRGEHPGTRCRGIILMAISNKRGRMLLTTGNKERDVGWLCDALR